MPDLLRQMIINNLDLETMTVSIETVLPVLSANLELSENFQGMENVHHSLVPLLSPGQLPTAVCRTQVRRYWAREFQASMQQCSAKQKGNYVREAASMKILAASFDLHESNLIDLTVDVESGAADVALSTPACLSPHGWKTTRTPLSCVVTEFRNTDY